MKVFPDGIKQIKIHFEFLNRKRITAKSSDSAGKIRAKHCNNNSIYD